MTCLVIALQHDLHADAIVEKLTGRTTVVRVDPMQAPVQLHMDSGTHGEFIIDSHRMMTHDISGIFCRVAIESIDVGHELGVVARFAHKEFIGALTGLLLDIDDRRWINFPWNENISEGKMFPLKRAQRMGFKVPRFIVTNNIRSISAGLGGAWIIKPLTDSAIALQRGAYVEVPDFVEFDAPYTADFYPEQLSIDEIDDTPILIQEKIEKVTEIRAVVIDRRLFATSFKVGLGAPVDGRLNKTRSEHEYRFPDKDMATIIDFVASLGLRFATLDFVTDAEGAVWLLDVNPSGNWLWQEQSAGLQISDAIASALCELAN